MREGDLPPPAEAKNLLQNPRGVREQIRSKYVHKYSLGSIS